MKIHEDVETLPIEINVQSAGVTQEEQILTSQYFDETMNVKYYQIPFPQHLLQELLHSLHLTAHRYLGISKMLQEIDRGITNLAWRNTLKNG